MDDSALDYPSKDLRKRGKSTERPVASDDPSDEIEDEHEPLLDGQIPPERWRPPGTVYIIELVVFVIFTVVVWGLPVYRSYAMSAVIRSGDTYVGLLSASTPSLPFVY